MIDRLGQRIRALIGRCVLTALRDGGMQGAQVAFLGETRETEHFEAYGFTSAPLDGAEGLVLGPMGGGHLITALLGDRRYRLQGLERGEVALYTDEGTAVVLRRGGKVEVRAVDLDAVLSGDAKIEATGEVEVEAGGDITATAGGDAKVEATNVEIQASGDVEVTAGGDLTATLAGNLTAVATQATLTVTGAATITGAGAVTITGGGAVTITGGTVTLTGNVTIDGKNFLAHQHFVQGVGYSDPVA